MVSDKMDKTVVIAIQDHVRHPLYKKIIKRTVKLKAHDEKNECKVGDRVMVMETRPFQGQEMARGSQIIETSDKASLPKVGWALRRPPKGKEQPVVKQKRPASKVADNTGAKGDHVHSRPRWFRQEVRKYRRRHRGIC